MKRLLTLICLTLLLVACSDKTIVHEDVREEMAKDTQQILTKLDEIVKEKRDPNEKEIALFERYEEKYEHRIDNEFKPLTEIEEDLLKTTGTLIWMVEDMSDLESDQEDYKRFRKFVVNLIEYGDINGDIH